MSDVRFALRQFARAPGFTAAVLLTLAVGIGACAAIFSVVDSVLLRPLPFPEPDRVVAIRELFQPRMQEFPVASGKYFAWQAQATSFERLGALARASVSLTGGGEPMRLEGVRMSASTLSTFRLQPLLGRNFSAEEDLPGRDNVAILSHGLWQRQFGGRPDILNRTIRLSERAVTIVGVLPRESPFPDDWELFAPLAPSPRVLRNFEGGRVQVFGRLKPGVSVAQAQNEMEVIARRFAQDRPEARGWSVKLDPVMETAVGEVRPVLLSLLGAVGFLLLLSCANVANLLLARSTTRAREMAVRAALGARRSRLVRQLLVESLLLGVVGGGLGALLAKGGLGALLALAPDTLPRAGEIAVDGRVLVFTTVVSLLAGVGFGLLPAFQSSGADHTLHDTLKEGGRGGGDLGRRGRLRGALVVSELAMAVVLLAGAGLLMRSFVRLQEVNPGFRQEGALAAHVALSAPRYVTDKQYASFAERTLRLLAGIPGVQAVATTRYMPFTEHSAMTRPFAISGHPEMTSEHRPLARRHSVSEDFFQAMGIPLLRGRSFQPDDSIRPRVAIINQLIARKFFAGEDPIGKRIRLFDGPGGEREIVGVVGDVKPGSLASGSLPEIYQPFAVAPDNDIFFILRTAAPVPGLPAAIRAAVSRIDAEQAVSYIRPLSSWVERSTARQRFAMILFLAFSGVALLLAASGLYGVMAYSVSQRTSEIGVRRALGARTADVLALVFAQGVRLVGLGLLAGVLGAALLSRFLERLLFKVSAHDPLTFAAVVSILVAVAGLGCLLPARRASRVDPMVALRSQ